MNPDITVVLGIRPDVIRASLILRKLRDNKDINFRFVWSGQHYSDNLKDIFFRELDIPEPDRAFEIKGENDSEVSSQIMLNLYKEFEENRPKAVVFLGDTNTVLGCLSAAQLNIPIIHIEGCMRSYDWRMPEEKCRTVIDNLSDVIYTYFPEYKLQGIAEGLAPKRIVVIQNLIVDVLKYYYFPRIDEYKSIAKAFLKNSQITGEFYLATAHRRENVENPAVLGNIFELFAELKLPVIFPASYRTQKNIIKFGLKLPQNVQMIDPIGYKDMLALMGASKAVVTDSGTVVEETAVIGVPSVQMRKATERPQTYDCLSSVKFDPQVDSPKRAISKLKLIENTKWSHHLGDGKASERLVQDLLTRLANSHGFGTHKPEDYHVPVERSFQSDGLDF
jgi:UDP-N-acetylglucosamine 2-epimerase (non-hydrolysing)